MATYKLIQDIEAEDHILGPLSLRQFIFALIAAFGGYLCFIVATKGVAFLLVLFAPPTLFCAFFAFPFGRDQPTEVWFLAKLRFWFLPRKRIWNQSGVKELVTITVPKKVERVLTNGLDESEVKSRLQALANTIDSRGWAIKNINLYAQPVMVGGDSERLIDLGSFPSEVPAYSAPPSDIMDPLSYPAAQQMATMIDQAGQAHHQQLVNAMQAPSPPQAVANNWFIGHGATTQSAPPQFPSDPPAAPQVTAMGLPNEDLISWRLRQQANSQNMAYEHMRTMQSLDSAGPTSSSATMTTPSDPAILSLANNDDLNVATLAREAHKAKGEEPPEDEVVITLR